MDAFGVINQATVDRWSSDLLAMARSPHPLVENLGYGIPLTRRQKIAARLRLARQRVRDAWAVLIGTKEID